MRQPHVLCVVALFAIGCGDAGFERAAVDGTVTVDGAPLAEGGLVFVPIDGTTGQMAQAEVRDGAFSLGSDEGPAVGRHRVEITAFRKTGKTKKAEGQEQEEVVQFLPPKYNAESTLTADVPSGGGTLPPFELATR